MALTADDIFAMHALFAQIRVQSGALIGLFESDRRLSATFGSQQRWLMSHVGLDLYFRSQSTCDTPNFRISQFIDGVQKHRIASRNTADSYIKEMIKYKYIQQKTSPRDKRLRFLIPAQSVLEAFAGWMKVHLASLDSLAGGNRLQTYQDNPDMLAVLQPAIAHGLINTRAVRDPDRTFSLFTWLDNGGLVMDWLIASMPDMPPDADRVPVGRIQVAEMANQLNLSRTHLSRKLKEAEDLGSIGWNGRRGHSVMWVSRGFREEYARAQAVKLSIIDQAFELATQTRANGVGTKSILDRDAAA